VCHSSSGGFFPNQAPYSFDQALFRAGQAWAWHATGCSSSNQACVPADQALSQVKKRCVSGDQASATDDQARVRKGEAHVTAGQACARKFEAFIRDDQPDPKAMKASLSTVQG
jgi:hypothetical protein